MQSTKESKTANTTEVNEFVYAIHFNGLYTDYLCSRYNVQSLEFTVTRLFMKLFRCGSAVVVEECQFQFTSLPMNYQTNIRTARFLQKFAASSNGLAAYVLCLQTLLADS
jgi:hypothetical protein